MDYIKQQAEYDGVAGWHAAGYTGKGIAVWDMESGQRDHGVMTAKRVLDAAPGATVLHGVYYDNEPGQHQVDTGDGNMVDAEDFVARNHIKILTRSKTGAFCGHDHSKPYFEALQEKYNLIYINSAGNAGDVKTAGDELAIVVGACGLYKASRGKWELRRDSYSSTGDGVDFVDFRGDLAEYAGTSFAAPYLAGKIALLCERYGDLTQDQVVTYLRDHAEDMQEAGKDYYTGYGLPIMGNPQQEYFGGGEDMTVTMQIGSAVLDVDGKRTIMDEVPQYNKRGDRMMVPVKYVAEAFGCKTEWDEATKTVRFIK